VADGERAVTNYLSRDTVVIPTDPSQPFGNAARNDVRGPRFWQVDMVASKRFALPWRTATSSSAPSSSTC
jgi:hypothetical protein